MKIYRFLLYGMLLALFLAGALAKVDLLGDKIVTEYSAGDRVQGTLNVTFNRTNLDSVVRTNFGQNISLRTLLDASNFSSGIDYNCTTSQCISDYVQNEQINSLAMPEGDSYVGFVLQGADVHNLDNIRLIIASNSQPSFFSDLGVDVLGNNEHVIVSSRSIDESGDPRYGCFENNRNDYQLASITSTGYCENITLPVAPAFRLGANIVVSGTGSANLTMKLYDLEGNSLRSCKLPVVPASGGSVECQVNSGFAVQRDYLVCVQSVGTSPYKIRTETNKPCGTQDMSTYPRDYEIFAKSLKFDTPYIDLNEGTFYNATGVSLSEYIGNYISDRYGGSCSPSCVIPIRLFGISQTVGFSGINFGYDSAGADGIVSQEIYNVQRSKVYINSRKLNLDMGLTNFTVRGVSDKYLDIFIDGDRIIRKFINVSAGFAFDVQPRFVSFGRDTIFSISGPNVTRSSWTFGDGSAVQSVTGKSATHRYTSQGSFTLNVDVTRGDGARGHHSFEIRVGDARTAANLTLIESKRQLRDLTNNISTYPAWIQTELKTRLDVAVLNKTIKDSDVAFAHATNDSDFVDIVNGLYALHMPSRIYIGSRGTLPLELGLNNIDVSLIEALEEKDVNDETLAHAIAGWMQENYDAQVTTETIMADYASGGEGVLTKFKIETKPLGSNNGSYLIFNYPSAELHLASSTNQLKPLEGGSYITLGSGNEIIEFAIDDSISIEQLGAYISPPLSDLAGLQVQADVCNENKKCESDFGETRDNCPSDCQPWGIAYLLWGIIILVGLGGYALIHWWYKNRYENSLFKNKQDLANLGVFIANATRTGMKEKDVRKKLKSAGWSGEQISYALKKVKRGGAEDARFIKRPSFT